MRARRSTALSLAFALVLAALSSAPAFAQQTEAEQLARVAALGRSDGETAAEALDDIVRGRRSLRVRTAAARALGAVDAPSTTRRLLQLVQRGGPDDVRDALAESLSARPQLLRAWDRTWKASHVDDVERPQLVRALRAATDDTTRDRLFELCRDARTYVAAAALDAVGRRVDATAFLPALVEDLVRDGTRLDPLATALDLAGRFGASDLRAVLRAAPTDEELADRPLIRRRLDALRKRVTYLAELADFERWEGTDYARKRRPVEPPSEGLRTFRRDIVFVFDCTASEFDRLPRARGFVRNELARHRAEGYDVRGAVVGYRDLLKDQNQRRTGWMVRVHPLTRDHDRLHEWAAELRAGGVGEGVAATGEALRHALEVVDFHERAERIVEFLPATDLDKPQEIARLVRLHRRAHDTHVRLRLTRGRRVTPSLQSLLDATGRDVLRW